jgi:excisionase family DNA binding protein
MTDQLLLTPIEAARALGIGRSKLYELMQAGTIESIHIGRCRRIPAEALTGLIDRLRGLETTGPALRLTDSRRG